MNQPQPAAPTLSTLKILVLALAVGMMMLPLAATFLHLQGSGATSSAPAPAAQGILLLILAGYGPLMLIGAFILRATMTASARRTLEGIGEEEKRARAMGLFGTMTLVSCAMVESAGLFGGVVYYLTARPVTLVVIALSLMAMALLFPTEGRFRAFLRETTGRLDGGRFGG